MRKFFALKFTCSGELFSYRGAVVYHDNSRELEFLFEKGVEQGSLKVVELPLRLERPMLPLKSHPDMAAVDFPLRKEDFRLDL